MTTLANILVVAEHDNASLKPATLNTLNTVTAAVQCGGDVHVLNPKVVAINNAIEIDLFTQVSSETAGPRQISGTGGQLDFIMGAYRSEGGKGLICINSTFTKKDGTIGSRIVPTLSPGTIVTCPRSIVHYVVTEFGCAQMKAKSTWQRTEALINIAHPDFKDELIRQAKSLGIWRRANKIL